MKPFIVVILISCVTNALSGQEPPRAILQKAIKAHGGEKNLSRTLKGYVRGKSVFERSGNKMRMEWDETFELPEKIRQKVEGQDKDGPFTLQYAVVNGKGWIQFNKEKIKDYDGKMLPLEKCWNAVLALLPRLLGGEFELSPLPDANLNGAKAVGILVEGEHADWELYFDAITGLLVKWKGTSQLPGLEGKEIEAETFLKNYRDVDGIKFPMAIVAYRDGKKTIDMEILEIKFLDQIDPKTWARPRKSPIVPLVIAGLLFLGIIIGIWIMGRQKKTKSEMDIQPIEPPSN
jgi:hypothetical protein